MARHLAPGWIHPFPLKKTVVVSASALLVIIAATWFFWPFVVVSSLALADEKGEASSRRACDRIVALGPRAVPYVIGSIERNGPWRRKYVYLPIALKEIGANAKPPLVEAIKGQSDPYRRAYLIASLQTAFADYTHFSRVLTDAGELSPFVLGHFARDLREAFPEAPPLLAADGSVNSEFVGYWNRQEQPTAK